MYTTPSAADAAKSASTISFMLTWLIVVTVLVIVTIVGMWKTFEKAGKPGWAAIVPFYNLYVMLQIVGAPGWWLILFFIPYVNFFILLAVDIKMAKSFGKGTAFGVFGLFLFSTIGYLMIGFGKATYQGTSLVLGTRPHK